MQSGLHKNIHTTINKTDVIRTHAKTYMQPSTKQMQSGLAETYTTIKKTHAIRTMQKHTCNCQQKHMQSGLMQKHEYTQTRLWKTSCLLQTCSSENCQKKSTIPFKCLHQALEEDGFAQHSC